MPSEVFERTSEDTPPIFEAEYEKEDLGYENSPTCMSLETGPAETDE